MDLLEQILPGTYFRKGLEDYGLLDFSTLLLWVVQRELVFVCIIQNGRESFVSVNRTIFESQNSTSLYTTPVTSNPNELYISQF